MRSSWSSRLGASLVVTVVVVLGMVWPSTGAPTTASPTMPVPTACPIVPDARVQDSCEPPPDPGQRDNDGDGVVNADDNCRDTYNPGQEDADRDGIGNVCDATPYPPSPTPTPTPSPTPTPTPGPAPGPSQPPAPSPSPTQPPAPAPPSATPGPGGSAPSCSGDACRYQRTVELRLVRGRLTGAVDAEALGCRIGVEVEVRRVRKGADPLVRTTRTSRSGRFAVRAPARPGHYYATVSSTSQSLCAGAGSPVVKVRR